MTITYRNSTAEDAAEILHLIQPFVDDKLLVPRSLKEVATLAKAGFTALDADGAIVGFAAVEIYSRKLAELQCLAVAPSVQGQGVGRELVNRCAKFAADENVLELLAISSSDEFLRRCGFDYSLPNQKRALFYRPTE